MVARDSWGNQPYYPISQFYRRRFGTKVYKIPVSTADDCPNRRGLNGMQTCVFCDPWGSAARPESLGMELDSQIVQFKERIKKLYKAQSFLVYFQAYTSTFQKLQALREQFDTALAHPDVIGLVVGTRPDCLSKAVIKTWQEYHEKSFVAVEIGVQSFQNRHLEFQRRGHTVEDSMTAIHKIAASSSVDLGIHLIFGHPGETDQDIVDAAKWACKLPISNVKLHNLHVLKNTPLETQYRKGTFVPIDLSEYSRRVGLFLQHLSPNIAVHRLTALSSRPEELVAPAWTAQKMQSYQFCLDDLKRRQIYQGQLYATPDN